MLLAAVLAATACSATTDTAAPEAQADAATTTESPTTTDPPAPTTTTAPAAPPEEPEQDTGAASTTVGAAPTTTLAGQASTGVPFPTERWPEAAIPAGVDVDALASVLDQAFDDTDDPYGQIDAVLVVHGGEIVLERYDDSYPADEPHDSWSVAKSVTNALLGVLVRDGELDMDAPAAIAEWSEPGDPRAAITPGLLARMSSGLEWDEVTDARQLVDTAGSIDAAAFQADRPLAAEVGTLFNYSTGSTAVNGRIIGDLVGTGDELRAWADTVLFGPLGIDSVELVRDANGYWVAGWGANMVARDFARFGLLYLRDGVWDGERILPEGWVDDAFTPSATLDAYGSGWWIGLNGEDTFSAEGFLGQKVVVVPDADLVVVVLAENFDGGRTAAFAGEIVELFRAA